MAQRIKVIIEKEALMKFLTDDIAKTIHVENVVSENAEVNVNGHDWYEADLERIEIILNVPDDTTIGDLKKLNVKGFGVDYR